MIGESAPIRKRIGGYVENAHDERAGAKLQGFAPNLQGVRFALTYCQQSLLAVLGFEFSVL
jgi:hypothetical protein